MITAVRMIQGIGAAMIFSTNTAVLISSFPEENRGRVIGYSLASTYAGLSSGPVIGGILNQEFRLEINFYTYRYSGRDLFLYCVEKASG